MNNKTLIAKLIQLADRFDEDGLIDEAGQIDSLISEVSEPVDELITEPVSESVRELSPPASPDYVVFEEGQIISSFDDDMEIIANGKIVKVIDPMDSDYEDWVDKFANDRGVDPEDALEDDTIREGHYYLVDTGESETLWADFELNEAMDTQVVDSILS